MNGLSDSLTIAILLVLVFGAVSFYLYSKVGQLEKKMSLLENLLISLKMSTEASLSGPDSVEAISGPQPISEEDINGSEEEYSELLKHITPAPTEVVEAELAQTGAEAEEETGAEAEEEAMKAVAEIETPASIPKMDVNYEGMSVKELQQLAKNRGILNVPSRKRELIDALKRPSMSSMPSLPLVTELPGAEESEGPADI